MGMRIQKKWDLLSEQGGTLAILSIAFLAGGILGGLFAALSGGTGGDELSGYLSSYLALAEEGERPQELWPLLWGQVKYLLLALLLSLTALGIVGIPMLFGVRGFFLSFPVACFCRVFGGRGMFPAFILFGLPALLWVPALFVMGTSGYLSARQLFRRSMGEGRGGSLLNGAFWCQAGVCVSLGLAAGLLEHWIVPVLLRAAARVVL